MSDMLKSAEADVPQLGDHDMDVTSADPGAGGLQAKVPMPPERVRFATVATLGFDGYEETFEVSILNLSDAGVACTGPKGMHAGDRLNLSFRLHLAEAAETFPCEVVWVHEPDAAQTDQVGDADEANYGMRFVELDEDLADRVHAVVRERAEGRAAEWTLPVMPAAMPHLGADVVLSVDADAELAPDTVAGDYFGEALNQAAEVPPDRRMAAMWAAASRRTEVWVAAGAGLVVGLGLALAIAGLSPATDKAAQNVSAAAQKAVEVAADEAHQVAAALPGAGDMPVAAAAADKAAAAAQRASTKAAVAVQGAADVAKSGGESAARVAAGPGRAASGAAQAAATQAKQAAKAVGPAVKAVADKAKPTPLVAQRVRELAAATRPAAAPAASGATIAPAASASAVAGSRPRVEGAGNRATLVLTADGPAKDPHVFWMADPRRLVVDVPNRQSAADGRTFDLDHTMVSRVRVGKHPDKVRFVVETGKDVMMQFSTRVVGNTVRVELRRP